MNNLMSNFSGLALSRMEMKSVKGGYCAINTAPGGANCPDAATCKEMADNLHVNWCCSSCGTATWVKH